MELRCKPGDLAVVVGATIHPSMNGRIVRCIRLLGAQEPIDGVSWKNPNGLASWLVSSEGSPMPWGGGPFVMRRAIADRFLRPIRDPGDDAVDETLRQLEAA